MSRTEELIAYYHMEMLEAEGTWVHQYYAAKDLHVTGMYGLYINDPPSLSRFHRLSVDELWSFYEGDPIDLYLLNPDGTTRHVMLGPDETKGQVYQCAIPEGTWQGARLHASGAYALYGCTCSPGFTPEVFEAGRRKELLKQYPDQKEIIEELTLRE